MNFVITDATAGYDALGRMKVYTEAATATLPSANLSWDYDANGNIRRTVSTYVTVGGNGAASAPVTSDYWFRFDAMNRVVTDRGSLVNGAIVRAPAVFGQGGGQDIQYDAAGQRVAVLRTDQTIGGYYAIQRFETRESYAYDAGGRLIEIAQSTGQASSGAASGGAYVAPAPLAGTRRSSFGYDLAGHQTQQSDYEANGGTIVYSRAAVYGFDGRVTTESVSTKKTDGATYTSTSSYYYGSGADYALGNVVSLSTSNTRNSVFQSSGTTTNSYVYQDGAAQSIIQHISNSGSQGYTFFTYDALGTLERVQVNDGRSRTITFVNDIDGQIIRRDEQDASSQGDPHERWYRFNGRQLGYTGNNGTDDLTAAASIEDRKVISPSTPGAFRNGQTAGASYADFAQSYDPLNSYGQGSQAGGYTVRGGETLPGIAQNLWGDAGLWYKLAEANGLSATSTLTAGTTLTLPAGVVKTTHNANTLTPYDPAEAIGDVSPTTPQPNKPKKNKCGVFGQILVLAVSLAVTAITTPFLGPLAPIAGNIAGQGFGLATGIQQGGFNWKSLGSTALRSVLPQGLGILDSALIEAGTQGIEQGIGLRDKFDWGGVAAAGVLGGLRGLAAGIPAANSVGGQIAQRVAVNAAYTLADAATRSAVNGNNFGDNIRAALPGALVRTAGDIARDAAAGRLSGDYYRKQAPVASGGGGGGGSTFGSGMTVGQRIEAMLPDVTSTASLRQVAYNVTPSGSPASYGAFGDTALAMVRTLLNLPDPNDIVVTARREQVTEAEHSWGWKFADALGFHSFDVSRFAVNAVLTIGIAKQRKDNFVNGAVRSAYDLGSGAVKSLYHVLTTDPRTTIRSMGEGAAKAVNRALIAEDTPAIVQLSRARSSVANASAYDVGYGLVQIGGNVALLAAPELAGASRLKFVGGAGNVGIEAAGRWGAAAESVPSVIIATERGVAMTPELLSLQGTSKIVGDFRGINGARVEEIISRVPDNWTLASQEKGMGIRFFDDAGLERIRLHGPSARAPAGSNSASGWTARVAVPGRPDFYYDNVGNIVGFKANEGHIPIYGNPRAGN